MLMKITDMKQTPTIRKNEQGFASIVVALILIIVLALMTIAFAQLARREQQNALSKQLANQAYYAAESGVNDAYAQIQKWVKSGLPDIDPNTCIGKDPNTGGKVPELQPLIDSYSLDAQHGVSYSCMLLNLQPPNLLWQDVTSESDRTATFSGALPSNGDSATIHSLTIYWGSADGSNNPNDDPNTKFLPLADWTSASNSYLPLLEINLTPYNKNGFKRGDLLGKTFTAYLFPSPSSSAGSVQFTTSGAPIVKGKCLPPSSDPGSFPCSVTITDIPGSANTSYLIHVINHYDITIRPTYRSAALALLPAELVAQVTSATSKTAKRLSMSRAKPGMSSSVCRCVCL
jgi:hypothetical protein